MREALLLHLLEDSHLMAARELMHLLHVRALEVSVEVYSTAHMLAVREGELVWGEELKRRIDLQQSS